MCLQDRSAQPAFDKITGYIQKAKDAGGEVLIGGSGDDSKGYFIQPTIFTGVRVIKVDRLSSTIIHVRLGRLRASARSLRGPTRSKYTEVLRIHLMLPLTDCVNPAILLQHHGTHY